MALRKIGSVAHGSAEVRIYRDAEFNEYRARLYIGGVLQELADHHDDDKGSAFDTARVMAKHADNMQTQGA